MWKELEPRDESGKRRTQCLDCGAILPPNRWRLEQIRCNCSRSIAICGVGTELHKLLESLGVKPTASCQCAAKRAEWDRNGVAWAREHKAEIVAHVQEAYDAASVLDKLRAGANAMTQGLPMTIEGLVEEAIRRAELASPAATS